MKRLLLVLCLLGGSALYATMIINENFEGTGTPSGWAGIADFDYTAVPLVGSQSLRSVFTNYGFIDTASGLLNNSEIWFKFVFKAENLPASFDIAFYFRDNATTAVYQVYILPSGRLRLSELAAQQADTVDAISAGTVYDFWGHYKAGSGSNAIEEFSFDVHGNPRPNSGNKYASFTNGSRTTNVTGWVGFPQNDVTCVYDDVQICDTDCFAGGPTPTASPSPTATATATATATSTPTPTATSTPTPTLATDDCYSETNRNSSTALGSDPGLNTQSGQTFVSNGGTLGQATFFMARSLSPTGNATAALYATSGGLPTGAALATSDPLDVSTLTGSFVLRNFAFNTANQYAMVNGTTYAIVVQYVGNGTSANVVLGVDTTSPTHTGQNVNFIVGGSSWSANSAVDVCFCVYVFNVATPTPTASPLPSNRFFLFPQ